jgi:hypothetical protein
MKGVIGALLATTLLVPAVMFAQDDNNGNGPKKLEAVEIKKDEKKKDEIKKDEKNTLPKMTVSIEPQGKAKLVGTISAISGSNLSVNSWGGTWAVTVDATSTKIIRRLGGVSNLSEFQVGDTLSVQGTAASTSLTIIAKTIQNESIQMIKVDRNGVVSNISGATFDFVASGKTYKITTDATTKFVINGKESSISGLVNGLSARIVGVWNRNNTSVVATRVEQKTLTNVSGTISNVTASGFTLTTQKAAVLNVTVDASTDIRLNGQVVPVTALTNTAKAEVKGVWTSSTSTIAATKIAARAPKVMPPVPTTNASGTTETH